MSWLHRFHKSTHQPNLPAWTSAPEPNHADGKFSDAPEDEYESAETFCKTNPLEQPRLLPSDVISQIGLVGARYWTLEVPRGTRFRGSVHLGDGSSGGGFPGITYVNTTSDCYDTCLLSNVPMIGGLYHVNPPLRGVYFEVKISEMKGVIAIGFACRPYPSWRFPGWNRLSAGLHLDDMRKFFENPNGGQDYTSHLRSIDPKDVVGCGYEFFSGEVFYTYNGSRLAPAFKGLYFPREAQDVYVAVGAGGENRFEVNFGGDRFLWKPGNTEEWDVTQHIGNLGGSSTNNEGLPSYLDARASR